MDSQKIEIEQEIEGPKFSESYFWNCLTLQENCPFFDREDSKIFYFGVGVVVLYIAFFFVILADLKFWWRLDQTQKKIYERIHSLQEKIKNMVDLKNTEISDKERIEQQLQLSHRCTCVVSALRASVASDSPTPLSALFEHGDEHVNNRRSRWPDHLQNPNTSVN